MVELRMKVIQVKVQDKYYAYVKIFSKLFDSQSEFVREAIKFEIIKNEKLKKELKKTLES